MVYTSASLSLALLEKMAHLRDYRRLLNEFVAVKASFDAQQVSVCELETFHHARGHGWMTEEETEETPDGPWTLQIRDTNIRKIIYGDWRATSSQTDTKELGDEWANSHISPVLKVPSIVMPLEHNYLLNPDHAAFDELTVSDPQTLPIDPRLVDG